MRRKCVNKSELFDKSNDVNDEVFNLYPVTCTKFPPSTVDILVNDNNIQMEIDTGASLTIMSYAKFKKLNCDEKLIVNSFSAKLKTYTGEIIIPIGVVEFDVKYGAQNVSLPIIILSGSGPTLMGRNWIEVFKLNWKDIFSINKMCGDNSRDLNAVLETYSRRYLIRTWVRRKILLCT